MTNPIPNNGVRVTRREAFRASGLLAGAMLGSAVIGSAAAGAQGADSNSADTEGEAFEEFGKRWLELAEGLLAQSEPNEDAYLYRLCSLLSDLPPAAIPNRMRTVWDGDGMKTGPAWVSTPVFAVELELEPGAVVRAHNHETYNNVTLGLEGDCRVRHFDTVGVVPDFRTELEQVFHLREMLSARLIPGRMSHLSRTRDNIHWFQAGEKGARLMDFTLGFGGDSGFSAIELGADPVDARLGVYEAHWIGNPYK